MSSETELHTAEPTALGHFLPAALDLALCTGIKFVFRDVSLCWDTFWCGVANLLNPFEESSGGCDETWSILKCH